MSKSITVNIGGMSCGGCANTVRNAIEDIDGVDRAEVDHESGKTDVYFSEVDDIEEQIAERVEAEGYTLNK